VGRSCGSAQLAVKYLVTPNLHPNSSIVHVNRSIKLSLTLMANKWLTAANFLFAQMKLDNGCPLLEDETESKVLGMK